VKWASGLIVVLGLLGCRERNRSDAERVDSSTSEQMAHGALPHEQLADSGCVALSPNHVMLSGRVFSQQRYGPPGYGENPSADERVEILVLQLPKALRPCSTLNSDTTRREGKPISEVQLVGKFRPDELAEFAGSRLEAFGSLRAQTWGTDYTELILEVDSIPMLSRRSQPAT
jgi:hypothetical protein